MAKLKRELETTLPCGDYVTASRGPNSGLWMVRGYPIPGGVAVLDLSAKNAQAIIDLIRELSENTPGGLRK